MRSTKEVLDHHLTAFGNADLEGVLSDYTEDAVLFTPNGPLKSQAERKPMFEAFFEEFAKPGTSFALKHESVVGDYAYMIWTADTPDNLYDVMSDMFVVRNGKIVAHCFGGKIVPKK